MELTVLRYSSGAESTLGLLFIDNKFACYTLEDEFRDIKIAGETRIPEGRYKLKLRYEGTLHNRYTNKFPKIHKGMLHITNVPNFKYILIHIGNTDDDTAGCLLVGESSITNINQPGRINNSTIAYKRIYPLIAHTILKGKDVWICFKDAHTLI